MTVTQEFERRGERQWIDPAGFPPVRDSDQELLSAAEAERVLRRAIEHQSNEDVPTTTLDMAALERVAAEVGVAREHLARALAEIRAEGERPELSLVDRLLVPDRIMERAVIERPLPQVEAAIHDWMVQHEGMRLRARLPDGGRWERDTHWLTRLRMGLNFGRPKALRRARDVTHHVRPIHAHEQVVALQADTSRPRAIGLALLGAGAAAAAAGGAAAAVAGEPMLAAGIVGGFAAFSTGVVLGVRMWADRIRNALGRALDGISHPDLTDPGLPEHVDRLQRQIFVWRWRS